MNKRTILSIIIGSLCLMNFFAPLLGEDITYSDFFLEAFSNPEIKGGLKALMMAPTSIILILTALHIAEPRTKFVTRDLLAVASIIGFLLYLAIYGIMYAATSFAYILGDAFTAWLSGNANQQSEVAILEFGFVPLLYPILFLAYVLVHRYMSYESTESHYSIFQSKTQSSNESTRNHDDNEFV